MTVTKPSDFDHRAFSLTQQSNRDIILLELVVPYFNTSQG